MRAWLIARRSAADDGPGRRFRMPPGGRPASRLQGPVGLIFRGITPIIASYAHVAAVDCSDRIGAWPGTKGDHGSSYPECLEGLQVFGRARACR